MAIYLTGDIFAGLVSNLTSNVINKFEMKISEKVALRVGKGFTLYILNEYMNDIIKVIKP